MKRALGLSLGAHQAARQGRRRVRRRYLTTPPIHRVPRHPGRLPHLSLRVSLPHLSATDLLHLAILDLPRLAVLDSPQLAMLGRPHLSMLHLQHLATLDLLHLVALCLPLLVTLDLQRLVEFNPLHLAAQELPHSQMGHPHPLMLHLRSTHLRPNEQNHPLQQTHQSLHHLGLTPTASPTQPLQLAP